MNYKFIVALAVSAITQPFICCMHVDAPLGLDLLVHYRPHDDSSQDKNDLYSLTSITEHQRAEQLLNDVIDVAKGKKLVNKAKLNELFLSAVQYRNTTTFIDDLLERGADIKAQNALGDTALHLAIEKGYRPAITVIFEWAKKKFYSYSRTFKEKKLV